MPGSQPILRRTILNYRFRPNNNISSTLPHTIVPWTNYCISTASRFKIQNCNNTSSIPRILIRNFSYSTNDSSKKEVSNTNNTELTLDWNTFFQLRKKRRLYQQFFSFTASLGGVISATQILMHSDIEAFLSVSQIPLDPFITLGLVTFTCGGLGWLLGPAAGTALFNWKNRELRAQIELREKEFYRRVRRYRVDPSNSSMANPVPDYYGEKVSSVHDYRQWLKDCRAFNKKRTTYLK
ncbi:Presequence translocated-associated motor subunit pam17, mitochondrial [Erysiphe neolycopersici]|uniref:Presequence translocated-associated motor subunit PAM17 n=1 Tax=Erysiphe neolycopersici TaxID=212602 RepID=A0A420I418_9PEZI|nr:Presequence translocated-associated motor subunit pam17, mitochondrial [Erysiphe neolycopersici]